MRCFGISFVEISIVACEVSAPFCGDERHIVRFHRVGMSAVLFGAVLRGWPEVGFIECEVSASYCGSERHQSCGHLLFFSEFEN